jgi:hypothetical protein
LLFVFLGNVLAGAAYDPRRVRGHHFHEDFDLDGGGTNLFHRNYDLSANDYGLDDETTLH